MQIKGCKNPRCNLCANSFLNIDSQSLVCMVSGEIKENNDVCKKFEYDLFKYEPENKIKDFKFTKEDFEI